jgi:uncharacterized paraquat-inducible protein A
LSLPHPLTSAERSLAWLITAILLYLPANLVPVMYVSGIGGGEESTIIGGILEFWFSGSFGIALLIFAASVACRLQNHNRASVYAGACAHRIRNGRSR